MRFDPALAAQDTFRQAEGELGSNWDTAVDLEEVFSADPPPIVCRRRLGETYPTDVQCRVAKEAAHE